MYRFQDHGGRQVGMRFDLTVPLARFAAQHVGELGLPFKRYHIATVWRGENTQRGRYREFMQCDFDTIGTRSVAADIETALVIHDLLRAIGGAFGRELKFTIRVNNRAVLNGLLAKLGLADKSTANSARARQARQNRPRKSGRRNGRRRRRDRRAGRSEVLKLAELTGSERRNPRRNWRRWSPATRKGEEGVERLRQNSRAANSRRRSRRGTCNSMSRSPAASTTTPARSSKRFLSDLPTIGSVCSGGRYDNLAGLFTKQELPGIGASLGLDRLLAAMEELGMIDKVRTPAPVFIPYFDKDRLDDYLQLAAQLRAAGIGVEVFPEPKKLGQQLAYADRRGFRVAIIAGQREFDAGACRTEESGHDPIARRSASSAAGARRRHSANPCGVIQLYFNFLMIVRAYRQALCSPSCG